MNNDIELQITVHPNCKLTVTDNYEYVCKNGDCVNMTDYESIETIVYDEKIIKNNTSKQINPTEFLIIILPARTRSKPSFKKPPIKGIEFEIAYFVARIEIPSKVALVIPWTVKNKP